jgi:cytochrome c-type biogenesis protein CcmH
MKPGIALILICGLLLARDTQQELIKDIEKSLMAPCCWSGTVYDHGHPEMEQQIEEFVREGRTKQEIIDYYVGLYGERILAVPVAQGFNLMAWVAPVLIAGIGIAILVFYLRLPKPAAEEITAAGSEDIPFDQEIERELKELD